MASNKHMQVSSRRKSRTSLEDDVFTASATSSEIPPDLVTAKEGDEESRVYWALRNLYNFTIASCLWLICCLKLKKRAAKLTGDETDGENKALLNPEEARIKEKLRFHFMNPFQKWRYPARRRFPWKFILQILSTILVTAQVGECVKPCIVLNVCLLGHIYTQGNVAVVAFALLQYYLCLTLRTFIMVFALSRFHR